MRRWREGGRDKGYCTHIALAAAVAERAPEGR